MTRDFPVMECADGSSVTLRWDKDAGDVFRGDGGFVIDEQCDELVVCDIDYEVTRESSDEFEGEIAVAYVYFKSVLPDSELGMAFVDMEELEVPNWTRDSLMIGEERLGVVYERRQAD